MNTIVMTEKLLQLLNIDELEVIFAHELAHLINGDLTMKALVAAYRTVIPFDPMIRLVEAAIHREQELLADDIAAQATGKPQALASALIKIYENSSPQNNLSHLPGAFIAKNRGLFNRHQTLEKRVSRLLKMTD